MYMEDTPDRPVGINREWMLKCWEKSGENPQVARRKLLYTFT